MGLKHLAPFAIPFIVSANATIQNEFNDTTHDVPARAGDFPFMVSVLLRHPQHICGGSLLDATTVLTAADCVAMAQQHGYTSSDLIVRAGSLSPWSDGWLVRVVAMITHPEFSGFKSLDKDVAILKLSDPIPQSDTIKYATLARAGSDPIAGTVVSAAGWYVTPLMTF
ncbi:hypothetical protein N0V94_004581 [Neodidymelliopsis sp. IMI 364377]|nr:hypothetical protein N0V94_004581 [Neodidymelliopsis sp. IMI 364377]